MTLPDALDLWAESDVYAATGEPTKSALTGARLAEGYVPLTHAVAAQEANEYLHRIGVTLDSHRDTFVDLYSQLTGRVPGTNLPGGGAQETTVVLPVIPLVGDWEYFTPNVGTPSVPFGVRVISGAVFFGGTVQAQGSMSALTLFVVGQGAEPADADQPSLTVAYGDIQGGASDFAPAGREENIQNLVTTWGDITPLTFAPATPISVARPLALSLRLSAGSGVTFLVVGVTATIVPPA
jgi:hypothetical protein